MAALSAYQLMRRANLGENKDVLAKHGVLPPVMVTESVIRPTSPKKVKVKRAKRLNRKRLSPVESREPKRFSFRIRLQSKKDKNHGDEDSYKALSESDEDSGCSTDSDYECETKTKTKSRADTHYKLHGVTEEELKLLRHPSKPLFNRPNTYGSIKGIRVGNWWEQRIGCSHDGVHRPTVAGIHFGKEGAYSVALSGGYPDDTDDGDSFSYTGEGGRDLKGTAAAPKNLRTAEQTKDQELTRGNFALTINSQNGNPVRVIRGYQCPSKYAPSVGYRYDGLYKVTDFWETVGASGFRVYKYTFVRCDEEPAPWHDNYNKTPSLMEPDVTVEPWRGWPPEASLPRTDILHIECEKKVFKAQLARDDWFLFNHDQEPPSPSYYLKNEDEEGQDNSGDGWTGWPSQVSVSGTDILHIEYRGNVERVKLIGDKWQTIHDDPSSPSATRNQDLETEP